MLAFSASSSEHHRVEPLTHKLQQKDYTQGCGESKNVDLTASSSPPTSQSLFNSGLVAAASHKEDTEEAVVLVKMIQNDSLSR